MLVDRVPRVGGDVRRERAGRGVEGRDEVEQARLPALRRHGVAVAQAEDEVLGARDLQTAVSPWPWGAMCVCAYDVDGAREIGRGPHERALREEHRLRDGLLRRARARERGWRVPGPVEEAQLARLRL